MYKISVYTGEKKLFDGLTGSTILPGEDGEVTVLDFHEDFLLRLTQGSVRIDNKELFVNDGLAKFKDNNLVLFVDESLVGPDEFKAREIALIKKAIRRQK